MGNYIDSDDVRARLRDNFGSLYELPGDTADLDADIEQAEAVVNSFCGRRYAVPVTSATAVKFLKAIALDLFEEIAWARGAGDEIPKKVSLRAGVARDMLRDIAAGKLTLGGDAAATEQTAGGAEAIVVDGNAPEFDRDKMDGF